MPLPFLGPSQLHLSKSGEPGKNVEQLVMIVLKKFPRQFEWSFMSNVWPVGLRLCGITNHFWMCFSILGVDWLLKFSFWAIDFRNVERKIANERNFFCSMEFWLLGLRFDGILPGSSWLKCSDRECDRRIIHLFHEDKVVYKFNSEKPMPSSVSAPSVVLAPGSPPPPTVTKDHIKIKKKYCRRV